MEWKKGKEVVVLVGWLIDSFIHSLVGWLVGVSVRVGWERERGRYSF